VSVRQRVTPRFDGLHSASKRASKAARGASKKTATRCELTLAAALRLRGLQVLTNVAPMPGKPDIVLTDVNMVVFCDGDFWHGRHLKDRLARLRHGHNHEYWVAKMMNNKQRDHRVNRLLRRMGWIVVRCWEGDIQKSPEVVAERVCGLVLTRRTKVL
jgi:DNA mismatch endonuclease, patch repair protein